MANEEAQHIISWQHYVKGQGSLFFWCTHHLLLPWNSFSVSGSVKHYTAPAANCRSCSRDCSGRDRSFHLQCSNTQCSSAERDPFKKTQAAQMKRKPGVKFKWTSFKVKFNAAHFKITFLLHRQHTRLCHLKVSRRRRRSKISPVRVITGGDIQYFQGQEHMRALFTEVQDRLDAWTASEKRSQVSHGGLQGEKAVLISVSLPHD